MNVPSILAGLSLLLSSSAAVATTPTCLPTIDKAWIRAAPRGATVLAGYAILRNPCPGAVAVTVVSSRDFAMSMMHETLLENGMSAMRHVETLPLPAHGEIRFAPGGRHLMLMHPKRNLEPGNMVRVSLKLADGRSVSANFSIRRDPPL